jgi:hypothetical protein
LCPDRRLHHALAMDGLVYVLSADTDLNALAVIQPGK